MKKLKLELDILVADLKDKICGNYSVEAQGAKN